MHGLYDESQPKITRSQEAYAKEVAAHLEDSADLDFPRAAKSHAYAILFLFPILQLNDVSLWIFRVYKRDSTGIWNFFDNFFT